MHCNNSDRVHLFFLSLNTYVYAGQPSERIILPADASQYWFKLRLYNYFILLSYIMRKWYYEVPRHSCYSDPKTVLQRGGGGMPAVTHNKQTNGRRYT